MRWTNKNGKDHKTWFGGNFQGLTSSEEATACTSLIRCPYIRDSVILSTYNGTDVDSGLTTKFNAGLRVILNINWQVAGGGALNNFCTDLTTYRTKISQFLAHNKNHFYCAVIENEPDNKQYWNYSTASGATPPYTTVADYLAMLQVAIEECKAVNMKVADGCVHLHGIKDVKNGVTNDNSTRTSALMTGYSSLNLDYCNFHFTIPDSGISNSNSTLVNGIIPTLAAYYKQVTGHQAICNEYHQEAAGTTGEQDTMCYAIVKQIKESHLPISIVFGGSGVSDALVMVDPATNLLTHLGTAYRDAIVSNFLP